MKRIAYIIYLAAALCVMSCAKQIEEPTPGVVPDGGTATFTFTPEILGEMMGEVGTKSMSNLPQIHNLYFAVFDNAGYKLNEYAQAIPNTYADDNWDPAHPTENIFSYSVTLTVTDQPRIIHVIANAPEHLSYGSETEVIGSLNSRYHATEEEGDWSDAYWVRIYLDQGVWAKPDESTRDTDEKYQEKYDKWMYVVNQLNQAKLLRNFTRIVLESTAEDFELTRYWLTNIPDIGSYAPYNRNTGEFQVNYASFANIAALSSASGGNYPGFYPASASLVKIGDYLDDPETLNKMECNASKGWTSFCYERELPKSDPIYLIVAGRYQGGDETYYKIDLRDQNDNYFPLLRNFTYKVNISKVATQGVSSLARVIASAPSGDVDTSLEMQNLTNISNGTSQLFVNSTSEVVVGDAHDVIVRYKFIPNLQVDEDGDGIADVENRVLESGSAEEAQAMANHENFVSISTKQGSTGPVFSSINPQAEDDVDDYRNLFLRSNDATGIIRTETVTVTGYYYNPNSGMYDTICRTISFKLRETLQMKLSFSPAKIPEGSNEPIDLVIGIEAGLASSMFSLDFNIEVLGLTLTTDNDPLPITSGESQIAGNSKPSYRFRKTITWTEYDNAPTVDGYKQFVCHFKTNTSHVPELSASVQTIYTNTGGEGTLPADKNGDIVNVQNKFFVEKSAYYSVYSPKTFTSITLDNVSEVGQEGTLTFTMENPFPNGATSSVVTVGLLGLEPADMTAYTLLGVKDGYELYALTVYDTAKNGVEAYTGTMKVVPFQSGKCSVRLSADEYTTKTEDTNVISGGSIYVNENGTGDGDRMVQATGASVVPAGSVVAGQKATLTVYLAEVSETSTVQFNSQNATRSSTNTLTIGGKTYYRYQLTNYQTTPASDNNGARKEGVRISVDGTVVETIYIPVYGIQLGTASTSTSHSVYTSQWYVFRSSNYTSYHLINDGTNIKGSNAALKYDSLIGFASSGTSTQMVVTTDNGLKYVVGTNNGNLTLNGSGTNYTLSNGLTLAYQGRSNTRYWRQTSNTGNVALGQQTSNNKFNFYPVTFVAP